MPPSRLQVILAAEAFVLLTQAACAAPLFRSAQSAYAVANAVISRAANQAAHQAAQPQEESLLYELPAPQQEQELQKPNEKLPQKQPNIPGGYGSQRNQFAEMLLANALKAEWRYNAIIDRSGLFYTTMEEFLAYNPEGLPLALELKVEGREEAYVLLSVQLGPAGAMPPLIALFYGVGQSDGRGNLHNVKQSCSYAWEGRPASLSAFKAVTESFEPDSVASKAGIEAIITEPGTPLSSWCAKEPREAPRREDRMPGRRF